MDKAAVALSIICTAHCILLPVAVVLLPALAAISVDEDQFNSVLLLLVLPTSIIALTMGCRKHRERKVLLLGFCGLSVLIAAIALGHDLLGDTGERILTVLGAGLIAFAHIRNHALCRASRFGCHETPATPKPHKQ